MTTLCIVLISKLLDLFQSKRIFTKNIIKNAFKEVIPYAEIYIHIFYLIKIIVIIVILWNIITMYLCELQSLVSRDNSEMILTCWCAAKWSIIGGTPYSIINKGSYYYYYQYWKQVLMLNVFFFCFVIFCNMSFLTLLINWMHCLMQ